MNLVIFPPDPADPRSIRVVLQMLGEFPLIEIAKSKQSLFITKFLGISKPVLIFVVNPGFRWLSPVTKIPSSDSDGARDYFVKDDAPENCEEGSTE